MDAQQPIDSPTVHAHKRQFAWQILVPLLAAAGLVITVAVLVAIRAGSGNRPWADVSTIWLIAPLLVFALLFIVVLGFLIYGIAKLLQIIPRYTSKTQAFFRLFSGRVGEIADASTQPFIWLQQAGAIFKSIFKL